MGTENKGLEVSTLEMAMAQKWRGGCGHSGCEPEEGTRGSYRIIEIMRGEEDFWLVTQS